MGKKLDCFPFSIEMQINENNSRSMYSIVSSYLLTVSALLSRSLRDSSSSMSYSPLPVDSVPDTLLVFCLTMRIESKKVNVYYNWLKYKQIINTILRTVSTNASLLKYNIYTTSGQQQM